ncbi:hypothetical protein ACFQX6_17665 [Streptosporangium lutulentum]
MEWEAAYPESAPTGQGEAILWALGKRDQAPISGRPTTGGVPTVADARAEIDAAERVERRGRIIPADGVVSALRWLIGAKDGIPIPGRQPPGGWGHLVGGRGVVVRSDEELNRIIERAKEGCRTPRPSGTGPGAWERSPCVSGCSAPARSRPSATHRAPCTDRPGSTSGGRDRGRRCLPPAGPGASALPGYGDGVIRTIHWLRGQTIIPPVNEQGLPTLSSR